MCIIQLPYSAIMAAKVFNENQYEYTNIIRYLRGFICACMNDLSGDLIKSVS